MTFIDKWSLYGGYFALLIQGMVIKLWPLFTRWYLFRGVFYRGLTVLIYEWLKARILFHTLKLLTHVFYRYFNMNMHYFRPFLLQRKF